MKLLLFVCLFNLLFLPFATLAQTTTDSLPTPAYLNTVTKSVFPDSVVVVDTLPVFKNETLNLPPNVVFDSTKNSSESIDSTTKKRTTPTESEAQVTDSTKQSRILKPDSSKTHIPSFSEINLVVQVIDSLSQAPLKASIIMSTLNLKGKANGTGVCNSNGYFNFKLTPNSHFEITVMCPQYIPKTIEVDFEKTPPNSSIFKLTFQLNLFQVGDVIQLPNINFKQSDFHLQREAFPVLDNLVTLMKENPSMDIKLKGHTDNTGSSNANLKLSQQRINEVRYYLLRKGIKLSRLKGEGYGDTKPLVPNNSPENLQKNRRVEFEVLKI